MKRHKTVMAAAAALLVAAVLSLAGFAVQRSDALARITRANKQLETANRKLDQTAAKEHAARLLAEAETKSVRRFLPTI